MRFSPETTKSTHAFTLVEMMVALVTTSIAVIAILSLYMYGMRTTEFVKPKLAASDDARLMMSTIVDEIRVADELAIGTGSSSSFTPAVSPMVGNAVQLSHGTNTNAWVRYYLDASAKQLKRMTNGGSSYARVIASDVTNTVPFALLDFTGKTLTNNPTLQKSLGITLGFRKELFATNSGKVDSYQLSAQVTKRTPTK